MISDVNVKNFPYGLITRIEKQSIPRGAASDQKNWMSLGDHIELRRGYELLGSEVAGVGKISGLKVGTMFNGTQVPFASYDRKIRYYDVDTEDWVEAGSDVLPVAASGQDVAMDTYHSLAGAFLYATSPDSSIYKIPIANPGSVVDLSVTSHRGRLRIKQNRTFLWARKDSNGGSDPTGLYGSQIDKDELSDYTEVTSESVGTGDGSTKVFTGTLAAKSGGSKRTAMYVRITDGTETFTDDRNGVLVGNQGGTGTINYSTMDFSVTFNTAPANLQAITADYYWEDATSGGPADFSKSTPRTAGQGFVFRQDDGGADFQNLGSIGDNEYCFHTKKTWALTLSADDTQATNLIYRSKVGIPYWQAMYEVGEGIIYIDAIDQNEAFVRLLRQSEFSSEVIPESLSDNLDLSNHRFDAAVIRKWGPYTVVACRHKDSLINDTMLLLHEVWKSWDKLELRASFLDEYGGNLIAGDSGSRNVFTLFSGFTDEDANIENYWITGDDNLDVEGVKVVNRFVIGGLISRDQKLKIYVSLDNSDFVHVGTIEGDADYVDLGNSVTIGSSLIGSKEIGSGGGIEASPYRREMRINTDKFERIRYKFEATQVGYVSVSEYGSRDIRYKGRRLPISKVVN